MFREFNATKRHPFNLGQRIMPRETLIDEGEVRIHQVPGRRVLIEQLAEEKTRFEQGGFREKVVQVIVGIQFRVRGIDREFTQVQPVIEKCVHEAFGPRVV